MCVCVCVLIIIICIFCMNAKHVEDEKHLIFECVRHNNLRRSTRWAPLYRSMGQDMKKFINQEPQSQVAHFVHIMFEARKLPYFGELDDFESDDSTTNTSENSDCLDMNDDA